MKIKSKEYMLTLSQEELHMVLVVLGSLCEKTMEDIFARDVTSSFLIKYNPKRAYELSRDMYNDGMDYLEKED